MALHTASLKQIIRTNHSSTCDVLPRGRVREMDWVKEHWERQSDIDLSAQFQWSSIYASYPAYAAKL